jgi:hypothetical protein
MCKQGFRLGYALWACLVLAGCQSPLASPELSGFILHHEQLQPGQANQAQLVYINPDTSFAPYESVLIEPVVLWEPDGERLSGLSRPELEKLADDLETSMRRELAREFEVVEEPKPGTLRMRLALVEVDAVRQGPEGELIGSVGIEAEILDASTGERLVAVGDSRGARTPSDVNKAFDGWAVRARDRLSAFRAFDAVHAPVEQN